MAGKNPYTMLRFLRRLGTADKSVLLRACWRSARPRQKKEVSLRRSLEAGYRWICAAQDATPDGGVSAWYHLVEGWSASYPETTGYIIPMLLTYASAMSEPEARNRAIRMADWEVEVQLPTGAVRSGTLAAKVGPAVFNTGQVLFGWVAAYQVTGDNKYAEAIRKAAQWLIQVQDEDGAWRKALSLMTSSQVQTYNVRSAWGLAQAGVLLDEPKWVEAACRNSDWALGQQRENGWFDCNGFSDNEIPLLHTIGYTLEGLLGMGTLLRREQYIHAAETGVRSLIERYEKSGRLRGRYAADWDEGVPWRCLTGEAQLALVLLRLAKYRADGRAALVATHILEDLSRIQDLETSRPEIHGALAGSEPVWGAYCPFRYPNWAVKFYMDALLLTLFHTDVQDSPGSGQPQTSQQPESVKALTTTGK